MTRYIAAYDTEMPDECLAACRLIRAAHERAGFPATFFIVGQRLEREGSGFRAVLGGVPEFELASHTYSHRMLRDHPFCGTAVPPDERLHQIRRGKELVEETFGRPCVGMRPGCGFDQGLRGDPWLAEAVAEAGFGYISSQLWGPQMSLPALPAPPYTYADEGQPHLWELPACGWHENVLKGHNLSDQPQRLTLWPPPLPEAIPPGLLHTPEEEFALNRLFIDRAVALGLPYVSFIWHPWSLARFDPQMRMLDLTFDYVRDRGLAATTFAEEWRRLAASDPA